MTTRCNLRGLINNNGNTMSQITTESIKKLDLLTFPLAGNHLIEASAGTGKTYTIASLYVRLILGAADENDSDSPIPPQMPSSILVVTFTEAATEELRDRIRRRLEQAAAVFRSPLNHDDPFLQQLRQRYAQDDPKKRRLSLIALIKRHKRWTKPPFIPFMLFAKKCCVRTLLIAKVCLSLR